MTDTLTIEGAVAVVTGGASGIGKCLVRALLGRGASVVIADVEAPVLEATVAELVPLGPVSGVRTDVTDENDVEALFATARKASGRIDIVVSNAGIFRGSPILATSPAGWDADMDLNLRSHYLVNRAAIAAMMRSR